MTTEPFTEVPNYDVDGTGPYSIPHEYTAGAIKPVIEVADGDPIELIDGDFTVDPVSGDMGNLFLSAAIAADQAGGRLYIYRETEVQQGWVGQNSAREKGLERQLDLTAQGTQDALDAAGRSLRVPRGKIAPLAMSDGRVPIWNEEKGGFDNGPSADEVTAAQAYAEEAERIAGLFGDVERAIEGTEAARDKAEQWAENPEDDPVDPGAFSAKHWAAKSEETYDETAQLKADVELIKIYIGSAVVPIGNMTFHYFDEVPDGWLLVNGQPVTPDMPDLRQKLIDDGAPLDGNGDPLLSDPRGRVVRIWDPDGNLDPEVARAIRSFQDDALQDHGHTYTGTAANDGSGQSTRTYLIFDDSGGVVSDVPVSTAIDDSGAARISTETRMANAAYPMIIKAYHAYANLAGKMVPLGTAAEEDVEAFATALEGASVPFARNHLRDGHGAQGSEIFQNTNLKPRVTPHADLAGLGVVFAHDFGTSAALTSIFIRHVLPSDTAHGDFVTASVLVASDSGGDWPAGNLVAYVYDAPTGGTNTQLITDRIIEVGFDQVTPNLRRYWGRWKLPDIGVLGAFVFGFSGKITTGTGTIGGWELYTGGAQIPVNLARRYDWDGYSTSEAWRKERAASDIAAQEDALPGHRLVNQWINPTLDPSIGEPTLVGGGLSLVETPDNSELVERGVHRTIDLGGAGFYEVECLNPAMSGQQALIGSYVSSSDGETWPVQFSCYWYDAGGLLGNLFILTKFLQVRPGLRFYYATGTLPVSASLSKLRLGPSAAVTGATCEMGGFCLVTSENPISIHDVSLRDWYGTLTRPEGLLATAARVTGVERISLQDLEHKNRAASPTLDEADGGVTTSGAGVFVQVPPSSTEMIDLGIKRTIGFTIGGGGGFLVDECLGPDVDGNDLFFAVYVYSSDGANWIAPQVYYYGNSGQISGSAVLSSYIQISSTLRRYYVAATAPASADLARIRIGKAPGPAAGSVIEMGGLTVISSSAELDIAEVPDRDWYGPLADRQVLRRAVQQSLPLRGRRVAHVGDSIIQLYGIPEGIALATLAEVTNCGFGGCRMAPSAALASPVDLTTAKDWFSGYAIAEAIAAEVFTGQEAAADYMIDTLGQAPGGANDYRSKVDELAAINWDKMDALVISHGTNDFNAGTPIGDADSSTITEFNGALNAVIAALQSAYPKLQIVLSTPTWRGPDNSRGDSNLNANGAGIFLSEYQGAIMERGAYYQIPVCPMHQLFGVNVHNADLYLDSGHLHPNIPIGRDRYVAQMSSWLNETIGRV